MLAKLREAGYGDVTWLARKGLDSRTRGARGVGGRGRRRRGTGTNDTWPVLWALGMSREGLAVGGGGRGSEVLPRQGGCRRHWRGRVYSCFGRWMRGCTYLGRK